MLQMAIRRAKTSRPHALSMKSDYTSWASLTDRSYTGRHLPPASAAYQESLPPLAEVALLFERKDGATKFSEKSTLLFTSFAQWFTDGFLRTAMKEVETKEGSERVADYQKNTSNHDIDLCQIYGLDEKATDALREKKGGRLKTSLCQNGEEFPPLYFDENGNPKAEFKDLPVPIYPDAFPAEKLSTLFAGGVERSNVSTGYLMCNTLFLREHNRIAGKLELANPHWDDERLFQTARNTLIVILIRIAIEEYINHITPYHFRLRAEPWDFKKAEWYRTNWMTMEFNLLYRWHSAIPNTLLVDETHQHLGTALFNPQLLKDRGLGPVFMDASRQIACRVGLRNTHKRLLETEVNSLQLAREGRLRSYNDYREHFGFPRAKSWADITSDEALQQALGAVYTDEGGTLGVDKLELYPGLFAEDVRTASALPPLIGTMVGADAFSQALTNPLLAVNVFHEATFSEVGWEAIQNTNSLETLLRRNIKTDVLNVPVTMTQNGNEIPEPEELPKEPPYGQQPAMPPDDDPTRGGGAVDMEELAAVKEEVMDKLEDAAAYLKQLFSDIDDKYRKK